MPSLALWVYCKHGFHKEVKPMFRALLFATIGDFFLDFHQYKGYKGPWFIVGMLGFLVMQIIYMRNFRKLQPQKRGVSNLFKVLYAALAIVINYFMIPRLPKDLQIPVLVYTGFLAGMGLLSTSVNFRMGLGGFTFMVSDCMIGFNMAKFGVPYGKEIVIVTYLIAQYLLITEWSRLMVKKRSD